MAEPIETRDAEAGAAEVKPSTCPDCGSTTIVEIAYGMPVRELRGESAGGPGPSEGAGQGPRWYCQYCFHRWPQDLFSELDWAAESEQKYLTEKTAEFATLCVEAAMTPHPEEPSVEKYWLQDNGRRVFLMSFPWGRVRVERGLHLVPLGGPPVYEASAEAVPGGVDEKKAKRLAQLAAVRFDRKTPV